MPGPKSQDASGGLGLIRSDCVFPFLLPNAADIALVFCDKPEKAKLLLDSVEKGDVSVLKTIVLMDPFDIDLVARGKKCGVDIVSMEDFEVSKATSVTASRFGCLVWMPSSRQRREQNQVCYKRLIFDQPNEG